MSWATILFSKCAPTWRRYSVCPPVSRSDWAASATTTPVPSTCFAITANPCYANATMDSSITTPRIAVTSPSMWTVWPTTVPPPSSQRTSSTWVARHHAASITSVPMVIRGNSSVLLAWPTIPAASAATLPRMLTARWVEKVKVVFFSFQIYIFKLIVFVLWFWLV